MKTKEPKVEYPARNGNIVIEGAVRVEVKPVEVIHLYSNIKLMLTALERKNENLLTLALGRLKSMVNDIELRW